MTARLARAVSIAIAVCATSSATAEVKLLNGWLRPAAAGQAWAMLYVDIEKNVVPGMRVPIELDFVDAKGTRRTVAIEADVRGVAVRPPPPADAGAAPKPG